MKPRSSQGRRQFQLNLLVYGNNYYIECIAKLEAALKRKPSSVQINLVWCKTSRGIIYQPLPSTKYQSLLLIRQTGRHKSSLGPTPT
jgi:hypothetical protein